MAEFVNTRVRIPGSQEYGVLRYVGPIDGKPGLFCGLELTGTVATIRGKNSGDVDGIQYFNVATTGSGLFVPYERLLSCNPQFEIPSTGADGSKTPDSSLIRMPRIRQPATRKSSAPLASSPGITHTKQRSATSNRGSSVTSNRGSSATSSRQSSGSTSLPASLSSKQDEAYLRRQLHEMQAAHSTELAAKTAILNELKRAVEEAQPILDEYEEGIIERDQKIAKQKADFDLKREEWRASMDILVTTQRENETFFEQEINALHKELENLRHQPQTQTHEPEYSVLQKRFEELENNLTNKEEQHMALISAKDAEIRALQKALAESTGREEPEVVLAIGTKSVDLARTVDILRAEILDKDQQLEHLTAINLASDVGAVSLSGSRDDSYNEKIEELEHELKMRPTISELMALEESLDQLNQNHEESLDQKNSEIETLKRRIDSLQNQLEDALAQKSTAENGQIEYPGKTVSPVIDNQGSLPIYQPPVNVDPGSGKDLWCGLCEREGHPSIACPYEQDIF